MNDVGEMARPLQEAEFPEYERFGPSLLEERQALEIKVNRLSLFGNVIQFVAILALSLAIVAFLPLKQTIPLFININSDGTHETLRDYAEIPESRQDDVVLSTLWSLIRNREEYYWHGAPGRYALVSALTSGKAQSEYQHWFLNDQESPQRRFGEKGHIEVEPVPGSGWIKDKIDTCRQQDWCEATYSYWRSTQITGQSATPKKRYTASLSFVFVDHIASGERATINPAALKVIAYHTDCEDCAR